MPTKPVIVIVHGAWCLPSPCYEPLKVQLEALGYECHLPNLCTTGGDEVRGKTWEHDAKDILKVSLPLFDQGKEVIMIAHSYGGLPAAVATKGESIEERAARGKIGGFRQVIYVAAFAMPQQGMDLFTLFGGVWPTWANFCSAYTKGQTVALKEVAQSVLLGDLPEALQKKYFGGAKLQSQDSFETPVTFSAGDITIPKSYLVCTKDECVPGPLQEQLAQSLGFEFDKIEAGHFPFLSQPEECLAILKRFIKHTDSS